MFSIITLTKITDMMKILKQKLSFLALASMLLLGVTSCSSDDGNDLVKQEQDLYEKYITPELETTMKNLGVTVNRGINPPNVEGYYLLFPHCIKSTVPNDSWLGSSNFFDHYKRFYEQSGLKVKLLSYENGHYNVKHVGDGAFISGEGNKFSIFFEEVNIVKRSGKTYTQTVLTVYSAELIKDKSGKITGLKNFQYILFMKDRDGDTQSIPDNTGRLFVPEAGDGIVGITSKEEFDRAAADFGSQSAKANTQNRASSVSM